MQANEIRVKLRDGMLVTRLLERVSACVATRAILMCVDGFVAYVGAAARRSTPPIASACARSSARTWPP